MDEPLASQNQHEPDSECSSGTGAQTDSQIDSRRQPTFIEIAPSIESVGKTIVVVVAVLYGVGLFVSNTYLLSYGITDFGLLKPRFVFTGLLFSLSYSLLVGPIVFLIRTPWRRLGDGRESGRDVTQVKHEANSHRRRGQINLAWLLAILLIGLISASSATVLWFGSETAKFNGTQSHFTNVLVSIHPWLTFAATIFMSLMAYAKWRVKFVARLQVRRASVATVALVIMVLIHVVVFTRLLYPYIPTQLGGGRTQPIDLYLESSSNSSLPTQTDGGIRVELIWQNESLYLIRSGDGNVWSIRADLVEGVNLTPSDATPTPKGDD